MDGMRGRRWIWLFAVALAVLPLTGSLVLAGEEDPEEKIRKAVRLLDEGIGNEREEALSSIVGVGDEAIIKKLKLVGVLESVTKDSTLRPSFRASAAEGLAGYARGPMSSRAQQIKKSLSLLADDDDEHAVVRRAAIRALGSILDSEAVADKKFIKKLVAVAMNRELATSVRYEALRVLGDVGSAEILPIVREWLGGKDEQLRQYGAEVFKDLLGTGKATKDDLEKMSAGILPVLRAILNDQQMDPSFRMMAIDILRRLAKKGVGVRTAVPDIIGLLKSEQHANVLFAALDAVPDFRDERTIRPLVEMYREFGGEKGNDRVRSQVCAVAGALLEAYGSKRALKGFRAVSRELPAMLISALKDPAQSVQREAIAAMGSMFSSLYNRKNVVKALIGQLRDSKQTNQQAILSTLEEITGQDFGKGKDVHKKWDAWYKKHASKLSAGR